MVTLALSWQRGARRAIGAPLAVAIAVPLCFLATGPTAVWRHSGIGAGRAQATISSWNQLREWTRTMQRAIVWDEDGTESSVALSVEPAGYSFIVNGKGDGSARTDAGTQVMHGLLGAILNPDARRSLVIGLGTGSTAGWLGVVPTMDRVDVVELEPLIVDIARACDEVNRDVLRNPKVHITIGDAREVLLTARDHYDLIASEPSNPFRAGVASLFTREYYQAASQRLTEGGLFLQWVQLYEIDAPTLKTVYATLASVFPYVEAWEAGGSDLVLVGAKRSLVHRADVLARRMQEEPFKSALNVAWRAVDLHGLLAHFVANERLAPLIVRLPGVVINTDDRNVVESGFARSVGTEQSLLVDLRMLARSAGRERPILADAASIDWDAVETAWVGYQAADGHLSGVEAGGVAREHARQTALIRYYRDTDLIGARTAWREQSQPPAGPTETAMLADIEAEAASDTALDYIRQLRSYEPGEADTILATLRFRQARFDDAAAALEEALENFRVDPWALNRFKQRAVGLAGAVATRSPQIAARMFEALRAPLSLRALHDERLGVLAALTRRVGFEASCQDAVGALEPQAPWTLTFLTIRRDCYQATGNPRLAVAARELRQFLAHEPVPLTAGF
jgi:spermidine synthase